MLGQAFTLVVIVFEAHWIATDLQESQNIEDYNFLNLNMSLKPYGTFLPKKKVFFIKT